MTHTFPYLTTIDFSQHGALPADTGLRRDHLTCDLPGPSTAMLAWLRGVAASVRHEADATRGDMRLDLAVAILTLDRIERGIVTRAEGVIVLTLATDRPSIVCGRALLTRDCSQGHAWVTTTTRAMEHFELPLVTEAHR